MTTTTTKDWTLYLCWTQSTYHASNDHLIKQIIAVGQMSTCDIMPWCSSRHVRSSSTEPAQLLDLYLQSMSMTNLHAILFEFVAYEHQFNKPNQIRTAWLPWYLATKDWYVLYVFQTILEVLHPHPCAVYNWYISHLCIERTPIKCDLHVGLNIACIGKTDLFVSSGLATRHAQWLLRLCVH